MDLDQLFADSSKRSKAKVAEISEALVEGRLEADPFLAFATRQSGVTKATCIEGLESATRHQPALVDARLFDFLVSSLGDEEPRVKWESARVIGNVAPTFPDGLAPAAQALVDNARHDGNVVRWAAAGALAAIVRVDGDLGQELRPTLERLRDDEEDTGVRKKYDAALKRLG